MRKVFQEISVIYSGQISVIKKIAAVTGFALSALIIFAILAMSLSADLSAATGLNEFSISARGLFRDIKPD